MKKTKFEEILRGRATYWGGHFLHPMADSGENGTFVLAKEIGTQSFFMFFGTEPLRWAIKIPFKNIEWNKVSQISGEDKNYKNKMTAYAYFAGYGPIATFSRSMTFLIIPYKDENGMKQNPMLSFQNYNFLRQLLALFYQRKIKRGKIREGLMDEEILEIRPPKRRSNLKIILLLIIGIFLLPVLFFGLIPIYYAYKEWKRKDKNQK